METLLFETKLGLFSPNAEEIPLDSTLEEEICLCCLIQNVLFIKISACEHAKSFFQYFNFSVKMEYNPVICYLCHNFLKKINNFTQQTEESFLVLHKQYTKSKHKSLKLQTGSTTISYIDKYTKCWNYITQPPPLEELLVNKLEPSPYTEVDDLKVKLECDVSDHDLDLDTPLSEMKKENKRSRLKTEELNTRIKCKKKMKKIGKLVKIKDKYDGKISVIHLNKEAMMEERVEESLKESYKKMLYKCDNCIVGFDRESTWRDHIDKRHTEKKGSHVCDVCKSVLSSTRSYSQHVQRHTKRYKCCGCGAKYSTLEGAVAHYDAAHEKILDQFCCHLCDYTADSNRKIRYHLEKHRQADKPRCEQCGNTFANDSTLKKHMDTKHSRTKHLYTCLSCNKVYTSKTGLRGHTLAAHRVTPASTEYCVECNAQFRCAASLKIHLATHSNHISESDKKFVCNECGNRYMKKYLLEQHINYVHLKRRDHVCKICSKAYRNSSSLNHHYRFVHEKIRPSRNKICDYCGRAFYSLSVLACHIRAHTGERPHRCCTCGATFAHPGALYTHNKLVHAREKAAAS